MASISVTTGASSIVSSGAQGQGSDSTIAGLKQKLAALNRDLRDVLSEPTEAAQQKAKAIQMKIQVTQAKLEQMIQQQAENAKNKQAQSPKTTTRINQARHGEIDVFV